MRHTTPISGNSKRSFVQAILLLVVLVLGGLGYRVLKRSGFSSGLESMFTMDVKDFRSLQSMEEEKKPALQRSFGGFWVYSTTDSDAVVRKYDCLELQESGIIWQVIHWLVLYPCGDTGSYYHVRHGYLNPYSLAADNKNIVSEVRTIRQVFIDESAGDTCFGSSQVDELWQVRREDSLLVMNRKRYVPYHGELTEFFPEGIIDLIDKILPSECRHQPPLQHMIKAKLRECYQKNSVSRTCDTSIIKDEISAYFKPVLVEELFSSMPYFPKLADTISLPVRMNHDGSFTVEMTKGERARKDHFQRKIHDEFERWPFPRCDAMNVPVIDYKLAIPEP